MKKPTIIAHSACHGFGLFPRLRGVTAGGAGCCGRTRPARRRGHLLTSSRLPVRSESANSRNHDSSARIVA
ncbi:hypothetical protein, partial [Mycobacterium kyorinense]|uniref:hypothetical protein n=1 Tax=Mycobacterium kyorinense TaxID=487514 RepID=UPI001F44AEB8